MNLWRGRNMEGITAVDRKVVGSSPVRESSLIAEVTAVDNYSLVRLHLTYAASRSNYLVSIEEWREPQKKSEYSMV